MVLSPETSQRWVSARKTRQAPHTCYPSTWEESELECSLGCYMVRLCFNKRQGRKKSRKEGGKEGGREE